MAIRITYKRLLECRIWHHYFLDLGQSSFSDASDQDARAAKYQVSDFMDIRPSQETQRILNGHRMRFIPHPLGFFIGMESDPQNTDLPFVPLDANAILRFYVRLSDPYFQNYSNLPIKNDFYESDNEPMIFRFSNAAHADAHFPNLTAIAPEFDNTAAINAAADGIDETFAYQAGDLLIDDQTTPTTVFEALRSTNNNTNIATDWLSITGPDLHFLNRNDRVRIGSSSLNYTFGLANADVRLTVNQVFGSASRSKDFTTNDTLSHQLDLRGMPPGLYALEAVDLSGPTVLDTFEFYLDENIRLSDVWGLIEIHLSETNGAYNLLNGSGEFNEVQYDLRIKNRSTYWRYLDETAFAEVAVVGADNPLPLTRDGFIPITRNDNELPNPSVHKIITEQTGLFSEIIIDQDLYNA